LWLSDFENKILVRTKERNNFMKTKHIFSMKPFLAIVNTSVLMYAFLENETSSWYDFFYVKFWKRK